MREKVLIGVEKPGKKSVVILHFMRRFKVINSTQHLSEVLCGKNRGLLFLLGVMDASQVGGKAC